jgi:hypothetical protein
LSHPEPVPFKKEGTPGCRVTEQRTLVLPISNNTELAAYPKILYDIFKGRIWLYKRPSGLKDFC